MKTSNKDLTEFGRRESMQDENLSDKREDTRARAQRRRHVKFDDQVKMKVIDAVTNGLSNVAICKEIGISEPTFYKWKKENEGFKEAIEHAEAQRVRYVFNNLIDCLIDSKDWRGWMKLLQCYAPNLYSEKKKIELDVSEQKNGNEEVLNMIRQLKENDDG